MLKIGEYIRTKAGQIDKVINNQYYMSAYIECENDFIWRNSILKHSKNIIDLIEVGDYVNGNRMDIVEKDENGYVYYLQNIELPSVNKNEIKTILTKEQYEDNCYKVKEE